MFKLTKNTVSKSDLLNQVKKNTKKLFPFVTTIIC